MGVEQVLVADGLAQDAADEAEVGEMVRVDAAHGVWLVGRPVSSSGKESVVLYFEGKYGCKIE